MSISEACYRYQPKLREENVEITDWLIRLTTMGKTGIRSVFSVSSQCKKLQMESQVGVSDLSGAGVQFTDQAKEAD
jgi:hypothetical protein